MIRYFPAPYPGEIFYSWLARYQNHTLFSSKSIFKDLFDRRNNPISISLPFNLTKFTSSISRTSSLSEETIIKDMTLWSYFSSTISEQRQSKIFAWMKATPKGAKGPTSLVLNRRIKEASYCVLCSQEDLTTYGEMYFHVEHQIPKVMLCTKHNCFLEKIDLKSKTFSNHVLIALTPSNFEFKQPVFPNNPLLLTIAKRMIEVAKGEDISNAWDVKFLRSFGLKNRYICRKNWNLDRLYADINLFYKGIDQYQPLFKKSDQPLLRARYWNGSEGSSPYIYVLMLIFIEHRQSITREPEQIKCINPVCEHFDKVVDHREISVYLSRFSTSKRIVECTCGMKTRITYDNGDNFVSRHVIERGKVWKKELRNGIKNGLSQGKLGKLLGVDAVTISYQANRFGIKHSWDTKRGIIKEIIKINPEKKVNTHKLRRTWLKLLNSPDFKTITQIKSGNWDIYYKLRDFDLDWLRATNQSRHVRAKGKVRQTDQELDVDICEKIKDGYKNLQTSNPKTRMSKTLICNAAKLYISPEHRKKKLPCSCKLLNELEESVESYQIRRITNVYEQLKATGKIISLNGVIKKANITKYNMSKKVLKHLESFLS